jgi:prohibitin 1
MFRSLRRSAALMIAAAAAVLAVGCTQIDTGNVGVSVTRGKVSMEEKPQGNYFTPIETINEFTTKEVVLSLNDLKPKTANNVTMSDVDVDFYFRAVGDKVAETYVKYQGDVVRHKDVMPGSSSSDLVVGYGKVTREAREAVYFGLAQYQASEVNAKRGELPDVLMKRLQAELDKTDPGAFVVSGVNVRNLLTDPAIEASIRKAAEIDQEIDRAKKQNELEKAKATANLIAAQGEAAVNRAISESLTPSLIRMREIEAQKAFAGAGTHTVIMGQSSGTLVNVGK